MTVTPTLSEYGRKIISETLVLPYGDSIAVEYGAAAESSRDREITISRQLYRRGFDILEGVFPTVDSIDLKEYWPKVLLVCGLFDTGTELDVKDLLDKAVLFGYKGRTVSSMIRGIHSSFGQGQYMKTARSTETGIADYTGTNERPVGAAVRLIYESLAGRWLSVTSYSWDTDVTRRLLVKVGTDSELEQAMQRIRQYIDLCSGEGTMIIGRLITEMTGGGGNAYPFNGLTAVRYGAEVNLERTISQVCRSLYDAYVTKEENDEIEQETWPATMHTLVSLVQEAERADRPVRGFWRQACQSDGNTVWRDAYGGGAPR